MTDTYRTPALPLERAPSRGVRALAWLLAWVAPPYEWQWYRRAVGGVWEERAAFVVPGCPTAWVPAREPRVSSYFVARREVWP